MKKTLAVLSLLALLFVATACSNEEKIPDSYEYIKLLASEEYFLDVSFIYDGEVYYNTLAQKDGVMAGRSSTLSLDLSDIRTLTSGGITYFINDEDKVYFEAQGAAGLENAVNYSSAKYKKSGKGITSFGRELSYDEYSCFTYDGMPCVTRLYLDDNGMLSAIADYEVADGEIASYLERAVSVFTSEIPDGWLDIPSDYTDIGEDEFFERYY